MSDYRDLFEIAAGPATIFFCFLIFILVFRKSIEDLINRVRKANVGGYGFDASEKSASNQGRFPPDDNKSLIVNSSGTIPGSDNLLPLFDSNLSTFDKELQVILERDYGEDIQLKLAWAMRVASVWRMRYHFELLQRDLFGSQIHALNFVNQRFAPKISEIKSLFNKAVSDFPDAHNSRTFVDWLSYLQRMDLVNIDGPVESDQTKITLSEKGRKFLLHRVETGSPDIHYG